MRSDIHDNDNWVNDRESVEKQLGSNLTSCNERTSNLYVSLRVL